MSTNALLGLTILLANAGLLVLQLVAGRIMAPLVGSSVETWTATIAAFLSGIALGNLVGGRIAIHYTGRRPLPLALVAGAGTTLLLLGLPKLLQSTPPPRRGAVEFADTIARSTARRTGRLCVVLETGQLWKAAVVTLKQSFRHIVVLNPHDVFEPRKQHVYVIYASDTPLPVEELQQTMTLPKADRERWLVEPTTVLTDQHAPVERMMTELFRHRKK